MSKKAILQKERKRENKITSLSNKISRYRVVINKGEDVYTTQSFTQRYQSIQAARPADQASSSTIEATGRCS
jgi:hypothetical protein